MARKNTDLSTGKKGMNRDSHVSSLTEQEYTFALNTITEDGVGEGVIMVQNEPSNLLCANFPSGFKVIGIQRNLSRDLTYFFLVNPVTGCSEVGYIPNINNISEADDLLQTCGCDINQILAEPLENNPNPTPTCEYIKIISDCGCENAAEENKCLNFDLNYPISSELKDERCGSVLYFTDDLNPRRRLELDRLEQYFTQTVECLTCADCETCEDCEEQCRNCEDCDECRTKEVAVCINCERLLVQQPYTVPCIDFEGLVLGGNLRHGLYMPYFAYTDENGFELTRYMSPTGVIPVKDPNRNVYQQFQLDDLTNYAIKLKISNIDIRYRYYKIAFRQRTAVDGADAFYETDPIPVGTKEVIWASNDGKAATSKEVIARDFPIIKTAKTVESANNMLFFSDLTVQPEINLQPTVNFLGQFLKWRTAAAEEDLYAKSEATAKWRSNMRDEVQPYAIRFFTKSGFYTPNFPLIGRVPTDDDLFFDAEHQSDPAGTIAAVEELVTPTGWKKDVYSILRYGKNDCSPEERIYKWQYYNTAGLEKIDLWKDCDVNVRFETREVSITKECTITDDIEVPTAAYEFTDLEEGEDYDTLFDFLNSRTETELQAVYVTYPQLNPESYSAGIPCCDGDELFPCVTPECPCDEPVLSNTFSVLTKADETDVETTKVFVPCADRTIAPKPDFCNPYKTTPEGTFENINPCLKDEFADENTCGKPNCPSPLAWAYSAYIGVANTSGTTTEKKNWIFSRTESFSGSLDSSNPEVLAIGAPIFGGANIAPIFPDSESLIDATAPVCVDDPTVCTRTADEGLLTGTVASQAITYTSSFVDQIKTKFCRTGGFDADGYFKNTVHTNALWWQATYTEGMVINISKMSKPSNSNSEKDCLQYAQRMRVSVYKGAAISANLVGVYLINNNGRVLCGLNLDEYNISGTFTGINNDTFAENDLITLAVDTPIVRISSKNDKFACEGTDSVYLTPTEGCFSVTTQEPKLESLLFEGEIGLTINKTCEFTANCDVTIFDEIKCDPIPWEEGKFAYWESTETYPDNSFLYDSTNIVVDITKIPLEYRDEFQEVFIDAPENKNFKCKPIRHFKFPDVGVSPITDGVAEVFENLPFKSNKVYPIGVHLDNELINSMLDIAVDNELITQEFRDSIEGYEIFKGDGRINRSIIAKGIMYDMQNYEEAGKKTWYPNFPYNDNHENTLIYDSKQRDNFLQHPYNAQENIKFTFHSPETSFNKPALPFEMKVEGYYLGDSRGKFAKVEDHPKFVLLGDLAYRWAKGLGIAEATLQLILKIADNLLQTSQSGAVGVSTNMLQPVAWVAFGLATAQQTVYFATVDINQKVFEWLKIFDENGTPYNFASYYTSVGYYNSISKSVAAGEKIRGLRDKKYIDKGRYAFRENFEEININNLQREGSVYLSIDEDGEEKVALQHPTRYRKRDNSRTYASAVGYCDVDAELNRNLYAPYVSLKEYRPDQYGAIDSVLWLTTSYCGRLAEDNSCDVIFGGDTFLSRFTLKRKYPFFINAMINESGALADRTPFSYTNQRNIGFPRFYANNKDKDSENFGRFEMPTVGSTFSLDCKTEPKMYVVPPSKFYLSSYGIPSFIVESHINQNYRHAEDNEARDFYPNIDYLEWTQEKLVSVKEDNYFFYRNLFSGENELYGYRALRFNYDKNDNDCRSELPNGVIYSLEDSDESDNNDNWKSFLANNTYNFGSKYGDLKFLKNIENQKVLALFTNATVVFGAVDLLQGDTVSVQVGTGGLFTTRPTEIGAHTDVSYFGTQHRAFVSSPMGYFWTDAKNGSIFQLVTGGGFDEISKYGMKAWFRQNLPFQIKKEFPSIDGEMLDNNYKGLGIAMVWDAKLDRLIVTKRDLKVTAFGKGKMEIAGNEFVLKETGEIIPYSDMLYFEDVSWTVSFNPQLKSWVSYHSYKPNFYIPYSQYFQSGLNTSEGGSVYSHLLSNRSFQVYYGKRYNWEITLPIKSILGQKYLNFVEYKLDAKRFSSEYDYNYSDSNFDQMIINSNRECSGLLNLVTAEKNNLFQHVSFPKHNSTSIDVLAINEDQTWAVNSFFDIVRDNHQQPIFFNKNNGFEKELNNNALNYAPFVHNRFRAQSGEITLKQTKESRIKYILEYFTTESTQYR